MAQADSNWSHWEGWISSVSMADAVGRTSNADCFICPGLYKMYVQGGDGGVGAANQNLAYNPTTNTWASGTVVPFDTEGGSGFTDGTEIWHLKGILDGETQKYDFVDDSWTNQTSLGLIRKLAATSDDHVGFGILSHGGDPGSGQDDARKLTFSTGVWSNETVDTGNNLNSVAGFSNGTKHFAVGSSVSDLDGVRNYTVSGASWAAGTDLPGDRYHSNGCTSHFTSLGYTAKGNDGVSTVNTMARMDMTAETWTTTTAGSDARQHSQSSALDREIFTAGGDSSGVRAEVESYNQPADTWSNKTSMTRAAQMTRGAPGDQHVRHNLIDDVQFTVTGLISDTPYYVALFSHDTFGNVRTI